MRNNIIPYRFILFILLFGTLGPACSPNAENSPAAPQQKPIAITHPLEFPATVSGIKSGSFVFAPPEKVVKLGHKKKAYFAYYLREVSQVGSKSSELKVKERTETIPNGLMIPLGSGPGASLGDIVLGPHPLDHGSLTRGIVAEGGEGKELQVHLLEPRPLDRLDNRKFKWAAGTFKVLKKPGEVGSQLLCQEKKRFRGVTLISFNEEQYLTMGSMGKLEIMAKTQCEALPLKPQVQLGDEVFIPIGRYYRQGKVKKIEGRLGRVYVEYSFGKLLKERTFPYGVIATRLPQITKTK